MKLTVNGRTHELAPGPDESLADTLRNWLSLPGTKVSCARGECGACTVIVDGRIVYSCITLTMSCEGSSVRTVEGLASDGRLHPVQQSFVANDAVQCGFCTSGQIMAAVALLEQHPDPDEAAISRGMSGNLCRCGTYPRIRAAIRDASAALRQSDA